VSSCPRHGAAERERGISTPSRGNLRLRTLSTRHQCHAWKPRPSPFLAWKLRPSRFLALSRTHTHTHIYTNTHTHTHTHCGFRGAGIRPRVALPSPDPGFGFQVETPPAVARHRSHCAIFPLPHTLSTPNHINAEPCTLRPFTDSCLAGKPLNRNRGMVDPRRTLPPFAISVAGPSRILHGREVEGYLACRAQSGGGCTCQSPPPPDRHCTLNSHRVHPASSIKLPMITALP